MKPILNTTSATLLGIFLLAGTAGAQGALHEWKGGIFRPSSGTWRLETTPAQTLSVLPTQPGTYDGFDILLPPGGSTGVPQSVEITIAPLDPMVAASVPVGARMDLEAFGQVGGVSGQSLGTLHVVKQPSGMLQYEYDLSATGATLFTVELWDGPIQVATINGLPGGNGGGPFFTPNCTCPTCPASAHCCELGAVYYSGGLWHNAWWCSHAIDVSGNTYNQVNRVVVIPENPTLPVGEMESCSMFGQGRPPFELTEMTLSGFEPIGTSYCNANPNSTGAVGTISALGSAQVADNDLDLYAFQLPNHSFGYFVVSPFQGFVANAGGSQGNLCIGASTGRYLAQLGNTGLNGYLSVHVNLLSVPQPMGSAIVQPGDTWNFQAWHRDANPNVTSNFTAGYSIHFQ